MKRHLLLLVAAICVLPMYLCAEAIPEGYYNNADGKKDAELKTALSLICRGGERYKYGTNEYHTSSRPGEWEKGDLEAYGTWQALPLTDMHPDGIVWDMYSNCVRYYPNKQGESGCSLNIEHCLPKSWWGWNDKLPAENPAWIAYKDLYNLNPSDQRANSQKSNYAPGHINDGKVDKFDNGSFRMASAKNSGYGYICWEPAEEYRGDFARTYFYMATAYEYLEWTAYPQYISTDSYLMFSDNIQQVLLKWHQDDPVSDKEICRADRISDIQGNRNPFIDYPDLVDYIWGDKKGQEVDFSALESTYQANACPEPVIPTPDPQKYDTLINLPGLTKAIVNNFSNGTIQGYASDKIQSNGTCSITMGASSTDGEISFSGLNLDKAAILAFRASPYNSATSMQLDVYAGETLVKSIQETVKNETRNEVRYRVEIPAGTQSIRLKSVGEDTKIRACMQELYLLTLRDDDPTGVSSVTAQQPAARKFLRDGQLYIVVDGRSYSILGK